MVDERYDDDLERTPRGPAVPVPEEEKGELSRRCVEERDEMTRHEKADCAGVALTELYDNEEDGGS